VPLSPARPAITPVETPTPPPPTLRAPGALRASAWMFYDPTGPLGCGLFGGAMSADCDPHFIGDPRVYHVRGDRLVREDAGVVVFDVPLGAPAGAAELVVGLEITPSEARIAGVVDGDAIVLRRSAADGSVLADYRVAHVGSPAMRVQLEQGPGTITVRALADRPWSAILDANDGTLIDRAEVGVSLAELALDAPDRTWQPTSATATSGDVRVSRRHARSEGEHAWDLALDDPFDCGAYAIAAFGAELAIVHHCPATSSAGLTFVDRATGTVIDEVVAGTIGSVGHSGYHSEVELAVARDLLWVRGHESAGTYVCVIDPREHRPLACSIHRT
jgi:hypothetical protein